MSQFRIARISLLLAAIGLAAPAMVPSAYAKEKQKPAAQAPQDSVRKDLYKLVDPKVVQPLMNEKKYAEVQDMINKADAFPERTAYENYVIDRIRLALASATRNDATAIETLERVLASGRLDKQESESFMQALGSYYYNGKNYPKAIETFKRYQAASATPEAVRPAIIRSYYLMGDYANARTELESVLAEAEKAGKAPSEEDLRLYASALVKLKDNDAYVGALEKLVQHYPGPDLWADLLSRMSSRKGFDSRLQADLFRLLHLTSPGELGAGEYVDIAELDMQSGFPTEAKKIVDAGFAAGVLGTGPNAAMHKKLRTRVNKAAADDARTIGAGEKSALAAKDGIGLVNLGYAYATMGQYDKGIDLIQKGIAKGTKRAEEAKLRLGEVYTMAGRKEEATKAFQSVQGDKNILDLARYWILYVNRPAEGAADAADAGEQDSAAK